MLVLSRKLSETITINENIHVSIVEIGRGQVKLGITAPDGITIVRDNAIQKQNPDLSTQIMAEVAGLLLETAAGSLSRQQTRQAMKRVELLMRKYADLKVAGKKSAGCCGKCNGNCKGGCQHG